MTVEMWFKASRVIAAVSVFTTGFIQATLYPGPMDLYNGMAVGITLYALWRSK